MRKMEYSHLHVTNFSSKNKSKYEFVPLGKLSKKVPGRRSKRKKDKNKDTVLSCVIMFRRDKKNVAM